LTEDVLERVRLDGRVNSLRGQRGVESKQVSGITGDMRGGHGSPAEGDVLAIVPGGDDIDTYGAGEVNFRTVESHRIPGAQMSRPGP